MGFVDRFRRAENGQTTNEPQVSAAREPGKFAPVRALAVSGADLNTQRAALVDGMLAHGVSADTMPSVMRRVRDGIVLLELGDPSRTSRIGGQPLLPPGLDWPIDPDGRPLTFIAALEMSEMPRLEPLPVTGTLLVFWSERYFELSRMDFRSATHVFYVPPPGAPVATPIPPDATAYDRVPLTGVLMPVLGEIDRITVPDDEADAFYAAFDDLMAIYDHQLLGSSRDVQGPVLEEVRYWFDQGFPETRDDFTADELAGNGWTLLGQIESTGQLMFGDAGALFLVIPAHDLEAQRFDRVLGIMQCS